MNKFMSLLGENEGLDGTLATDQTPPSDPPVTEATDPPKQDDKPAVPPVEDLETVKLLREQEEADAQTREQEAAVDEKLKDYTEALESFREVLANVDLMKASGPMAAVYQPRTAAKLHRLCTENRPGEGRTFTEENYRQIIKDAASRLWKLVLDLLEYIKKKVLTAFRDYAALSAVIERKTDKLIRQREEFRSEFAEASRKGLIDHDRFVELQPLVKKALSIQGKFISEPILVDRTAGHGDFKKTTRVTPTQALARSEEIFGLVEYLLSPSAMETLASLSKLLSSDVTVDSFVNGTLKFADILHDDMHLPSLKFMTPMFGNLYAPQGDKLLVCSDFLGDDAFAIQINVDDVYDAKFGSLENLRRLGEWSITKVEAPSANHSIIGQLPRLETDTIQEISRGMQHLSKTALSFESQLQNANDRIGELAEDLNHARQGKFVDDASDKNKAIFNELAAKAIGCWIKNLRAVVGFSGQHTANVMKSWLAYLDACTVRELEMVEKIRRNEFDK